MAKENVYVVKEEWEWDADTGNNVVGVFRRYEDAKESFIETCRDFYSQNEEKIKEFNYNVNSNMNDHYTIFDSYSEDSYKAEILCMDLQ